MAKQIIANSSQADSTESTETAQTPPQLGLEPSSGTVLPEYTLQKT